MTNNILVTPIQTWLIYTVKFSSMNFISGKSNFLEDIDDCTKHYQYSFRKYAVTELLAKHVIILYCYIGETGHEKYFVDGINLSNKKHIK